MPYNEEIAARIQKIISGWKNNSLAPPFLVTGLSG